MEKEKELSRIAIEVRKKLLQGIVKAGGGHTGGSLSSVDILTALYFGILHVDPKHPDQPDRDRFILSKGHSVESYHCVLSLRGYFSEQILDTYGEFNSLLAGHPTRKVPGIEVNSGALGHGLSIATGMALAAKRSGHTYRAFVLMGDGEQGEGSNMEAAASAGHYHLDNLVAIIDRNTLQISGRTEEILAIENLEAKYRACGWEVRFCNGHDISELINVLSKVPFNTGKPSLLIAHTIKGKGVSFIEDREFWHHKVPTGEELEQALKELDNALANI
ncbi:MAG: transketolase [Bacteroidales bacterium]|nr:MAG: transketolase [Bacteroidales bacterium]